MSVDVKDALLLYQKREALTEGDRAHISRWIAAAKNPVWQRIICEIELAGELPPLIGGTFGFVVSKALRARNFAETAKFESKQLEKRRRQQTLARQQELLTFASEIDSIVTKLHESGFLAPQPPGTRQVAFINTCAFLRDRAQLLRDRAAKIHDDRSSGFDGNDAIRVVVSRQGGRKGRQTREIGVFVKMMANCMCKLIGAPRYGFVASLANVAFRNANLDAEEVRQNCRRAQVHSGAK
jgi:hypothetical protein